MIFISLGTTSFVFSLAEEIVEFLSQKFPRESIIVQSTLNIKSRRGRNVRTVQLFPQKEFLKLLKSARIVVTHGGEGNLLQSMIHRRKPVIVVPRKFKTGEHVDDQQVLASQNIHLYNSPRFFIAHSITEFITSIKKINVLSPQKRGNHRERGLTKHFRVVAKYLEQQI